MAGGGSKNQTTTTKQEPPAWATPYFQSLLGTGSAIADRPYTPYGGEQVAGFTPDQIVSQQMVRDRATAGNPQLDQANQMVGDTLAGNYFGTVGANPYAGQNQYLSQMVANAQGDVTRAYTDATLPSLMAQFNAGGAYGGSAHQQALSTSQRNLADELGRVSTGLRFQDYGTQQQLAESGLNRQQAAYDAERQRQLGVLGALPSLQQAGYYDAQQLAGVGDANQQLGQSALNNQYQQWLEARDWQTGQQGLLGNALNSISGGFQNGSTTGPNPNASSPAAGALGGAMSGASMGSSFGPWGTAIGAVGGGLLGYFGSR